MTWYFYTRNGSLAETGPEDGFDRVAGSMAYYHSATPPSGWLLCTGGVASQATYPDLYSIIGGFYNTGGEGVGNFRLPNISERFIRGAGPTVASGAKLGASTHTHSVTLPGHAVVEAHSHSVPGHTHSVPDHTHTAYHRHGPGDMVSLAANTSVPASNGLANTVSPQSHVHNFDSPIGTWWGASTGTGVHGVATFTPANLTGSQSHAPNLASTAATTDAAGVNLIPPYRALYVIIKT